MGSLSVVVGVCLLVAVFLTAQSHSNGVRSPSVVEFVGVCLLAAVFQTAQNYSNVIHIAKCVCVPDILTVTRQSEFKKNFRQE